jgi:uncharacterized protein YhbP (UPF0306 family)
MCIATATGTGDPWISQVYFVADNKQNFYWYSSVNARHSRLIAENNKIAFSIFNSTAVGDDVQALYVKATCTVVTDMKTLIAALTLYAKKMLKTGFVANLKEISHFVLNFKDFLGKSELRLYKAVPYEASMLSESKMFNGKYVDQRETLDLI